MRDRRVAALLALALVACTTREPQDVASADSIGGGAPVALDSRPGADVAADTSAVGSARTAADADYYSAAELARVADALAHGSTTGRTVGKRGPLEVLQIRRAASGTPEIHDQWIDVTFVQSGQAALLTGGVVEGGSLASPGEHRGGTIRGGTRRRIGAGDLVTIPARTPHQYEIAPGDSLRYITVKVLDAAGASPGVRSQRR
jgi:hypothetical protein